MSATWRSYLPEHILRMLLGTPSVSNPPITERSGAVVLYADVVGFTAMTESFAGSGSYGTEQLTRIINRWFGVTAKAIAESGGSVVDFAGDALVGMFLHAPDSAPAAARRAIRCAELIREATASVPPVSTPDGGRRSLTIRVGLGLGPLQVMLVGDPAIRLQHLIAGPALDFAIDALHRAEQGEIVVDEALRDIAAEQGPEHPAPESPQPPPEQLERLLTPFLHPAIRQRLRSGRHELVNEHRKVSTAFVRLPDLSADDPSTVRALQRFLAAGVAIIDRYGGHLRHLMADDKGTVLVAVFGTPVSHENDEERALRCCLELLALPGGPYRGGVTTGPVYCGEVGSDVRREYAVVGDAVNLAARLMQAAPAGHLLIDQATYERTHGFVAAEGPGVITAKGKTGPIPVWTVREAWELPAPAPLPAPGPGRLVDRTRELAELHTLVHEAREGRGRLVWLHGEPGVGKSRLAAETCRLAAKLGFTGYRDSCRSHGGSAGYLVWRSILREILEIDPTLPIAEQQAALTERTARYDGTGQRAPLLAGLINLPMPESALTAQLDPAGRDHLLRSTLLACLFDRASAGPLVLLLEDCHWIDPASLTLLDLVGRHIADLPVLVLATSREPLPGRLAARDHAVEMPLIQMAMTDAEQLTVVRLRERFGGDADIAAGLVGRIGEEAGGNAFYIEELVTYLHGRGVDPGDPRALAEMRLPDSLQRLVMARIDELTDGEKTAIKVASVIGRRFQPPWIASVYPPAGTAEQITNNLRRLHALDLTPQVETEPAPEYEFKHPITQEAAYQSITYDTRASLHERVGLLVEELYADRLPQYVDMLAHHYTRSARVDKQRIWLRAAGDRAKATFANDAALHYYGRLLPLLPEPDQAALHIELGDVHHHTGQWADAEAHYRRAMLLAERTGQPEVLAAGQRQLGDLLMYTHSYAESVSWLQRALDGFNRLGDPAGVSRTMERMTFALFRQGAYADTLAMARQHLSMAADAHDLSAMSAALNHIGLVHLNTGGLAEALDHLRRALTTAERADDRHWILHAANNLGWASLRGADHVQAIASYRQALAVARDIGARHTGAVIVGNMSEIYRDQGDYRRARVCVMHSLRVAVELGDASSVADLVAGLGLITAAEGRPGEAQRLLERAIELARDLDAPYYLCAGLHRLASLHLAADRPAAARRLNEEALAVAQEHSERDTLVHAFVLSVRLRAAAGEIDSARAAAMLREAVKQWSEPHEAAILLDAVWQADPDDTGARDTAAGIYRELYERAPSVEYREAYRRLTGVLLPPGPPLPELPEWIAAESGPDLVTLLRRIDGPVSPAGPRPPAG